MHSESSTDDVDSLRLGPSKCTTKVALCYQSPPSKKKPVSESCALLETGFFVIGFPRSAFASLFSLPSSSCGYPAFQPAVKIGFLLKIEQHLRQFIQLIIRKSG